MASGLPIITTARGGNPEVITPNVNGFVVEQPEDPQAFVDLLAPLLSDSKLRKNLGLQGRKMVEENFTWDRVISDIHDVWNEVEYKLKNNIAVTSEEVDEELPEETQTTTQDLVEGIEIQTEPDAQSASDMEGQTSVQLVEEELRPESETKQMPPMSKEEKLKSILMYEIKNKNSIIESLLLILNQKTVDESEDEINHIVKKVVSDFEQLLKGQLQSKKPEPPKEFIQAINDITTAKLFTQLRSKRQQRAKSS
jgi:spore coat protein SA